ncbi:MAG: DNA cytosine methyltransferase [Clostridia bacterium]|nr:DNA cytosine methyltransferase [Clostridia bacterium]
MNMKEGYSLKEFTSLQLFCGIGGAAIGFQSTEVEYRGLKGRYRTIAGVDCDLGACENFIRLTGAKALKIDLFSRQQYIDFHGVEPPGDWREIHPAEFRELVGEAPDVIFLSPPCKGYSGLLPTKKAKSKKYQALNELTVRGVFLSLEAFKNELPKMIFLENVPRIQTRGRKLLDQIQSMLKQYGYLSTESVHNCGEIGGLVQNRKRFLMVARLAKKVPCFVYEPEKFPVRPIGEELKKLPLPGDNEKGGKMHRLPKLAWKTWVRLALIPAGKDWRALEDMFCHEPYAGTYKIIPWSEPCPVVNAATKGVGRSNGASAVADPRLPKRNKRYPGLFRVLKFDESSSTVIGQTDLQCGALSVADPRVNINKINGKSGLYGVELWDKPSRTITGSVAPSNGALSVADPRLKCSPRAGTFGINDWNKPSPTVIGSLDIHSGVAAVADPRIPDENERCHAIIISLDGTWHRPLTTLELWIIQGFPFTNKNGEPWVLTGKSDSKWREWIGNAVPPAAAGAIAAVSLKALLLSEFGDVELWHTPVWVQPEEVNYNIYDN